MGSGFKDWAAGDVLTAADVDGYLMRQTVMTFADASARDTALSGVLDEGMVAYLEDTNAVTVYNGSAWVSVIDSDVLTVDTANNRVGINDSTPSYALDVTGDINSTGDLRISGTAVGEWTTWAPIFSSGTGALTIATTNRAVYAQINEMIIAQVSVTITNAGTAGGALLFTLPVTATDTNTGISYGREDNLTGNSLNGSLVSTTQGRIHTYNNGTPCVTNYVNKFTMIYEA